MWLAYHGAHADKEGLEGLAPSATLAALRPTLHGDERYVMAANLEALDAGVRAVADALEATGRDYVLVVHSDNGPTSCTNFLWGSAAPLRGGKFTAFEGALKVPAFVYAPTLLGLGEGRTFRGLAHHVDWYATLLGLNGVVMDDPASDSHDLWPALLATADGDEHATGRDTIVFEATATSVVVRRGDFKLIRGFTNATWYAGLEGADLEMCFPGSQDDFLFDVENDPRERTNLIGDAAYAPLARELAALGRAAWAAEGYDVPRTRTTVYKHNDKLHDAWLRSTDRPALRVVTPWGCDVEHIDGSTSSGGAGP